MPREKHQVGARQQQRRVDPQQIEPDPRPVGEAHVQGRDSADTEKDRRKRAPTGRRQHKERHGRIEVV